MRKIILAILIAGLISFLDVKAGADEFNLSEIPQHYIDFADGLEVDYQVSAELLLSLAWEESRFDDSVHGNVCQITNLSWFREGITETKSDHPKRNSYQNMRICAYYLRKWFEEFDGEPYLVVRCWNEGYDNAIKNPSKVTAYSRKVVDRVTEIEKERGK